MELPNSRRLRPVSFAIPATVQTLRYIQASNYNNAAGAGYYIQGWFGTTALNSTSTFTSVSNIASGNYTISAGLAGGTARLYIGSSTNSTAFSGSVVNNTSTWELFRGVSSCKSLSYSVGGVRQLYFAPNDIVSGTTLPDREATGGVNNGTFTYGVNPLLVTTAWGVMTASGINVPVGTTTTPAEMLPPNNSGTSWFGQPDLAKLATNPIRPFVLIISQNVKTSAGVPISESTAWQWLGLAFVLFCTMIAAVSVRGHLLIAGIACGASIGILISQTIWPIWSLVFAGMAIIAGIIAERMPWV